MDKVEQLLEKYNSGQATAEEIALVEAWYLQYKTPVSDLTEEQIREEHQLGLVALSKQLNNIRKIRVWPRIVAAASVILCLGIGAYFYIHSKDQYQQVAQNKPLKDDILPGGNKAILTLANGKKIILTGSKNGTLAVQDNMEIKKITEGKVVYTVNGSDQTYNEQDSKIQYNTMTTPRGGQYWVVLPDGSKVLLNAASSLTYPVTFSGNDRKVELNGEAYFEVAHNPSKPFIVSSAGQTVEVLGTHFNINAYGDEPAVKTTLLEGKVKVTAMAKNEVRYLQPGQQAVLNNSQLNVGSVETDEVVAWKNGQFMFESDNIQHIMRMISRWYDVGVTYNGVIPDDTFSGNVSRFTNVSEVLKTLQLTGKVHFKVQGRVIAISK